MRWLHLSDIHFGYQNASVSSMRRKLLAKVQELDQIDCLFITGDFRYGKESPQDYPTDTLKFIQDLQAALKLGPENTFIVPGNHDVNRSTALTAVLSEEHRHYTTPDGNIQSDTLELITTRRAPFLKLYEKICGRKEPGWHYCVPYGSFNLICLNTAILCGSDGEDGTLAVGSALLNELAESVDSSKPGIVLAHHDFDSLRHEEQQNLEITLKEMGAVLYLCGHKHVALSRLQNTHRQDSNMHVFLCGTNMDQSPGLSQTDMDFFVGQTEDGHKGWVQAYKWYSRASQWAQDIEFSMPQNGATDGRIYFPDNNRPQVQPAIHPEVLNQYRQYICQQCSEIELNGLPVTEEDVSRRYALRKLFIPLRYKERKKTIHSSPEDNSELFELTSESCALLPEQGQFKTFILSDPGGGKSTLLKWIASVYCFPDDYRDVDTHLPKRDLFPVWLRCRDIPEGSRPSVWKTIQDMALRGEWLPHGSDAADFSALIAQFIVEGKMLLLIDGLDEIGSDSDRDHFVDQLRTFADFYPTANIIISSRPTGFSLVTRRKFEDFRHIEIAPLEPEDIKNLCVNWNQVVRGESPEVFRNAEALAELITSSERILRLAKNPLLLTTLLLVERRVGRLPTKRVELYEEAIRVLLETWNRSGHEHHRIDLDEARYQLAYVAFHMMTSQTKRTAQIARITRSELHKLLLKARSELSDLVSNTERPADFIKNIEWRSSLLIQKGYEKNKNDEREPVYEFQHLTFQEYLAAYAVNHNCYPGAKEGDNSISVITPHLTNPNMLEVVPLVAVRLPRFFPNKLADIILEKMRQDIISFGSWIQLRDILLQCIADEVALSSEKIDQILSYCFADYYFIGDEDTIGLILNSRNGKKLRDRFRKMDVEQNLGFDYHALALSVISGEIDNPYQYYQTNCANPSSRERANAITIISHACDDNACKKTVPITGSQKNQIKSELYKLLRADEDVVVKRAALYALNDCDFVNSSEELEHYFSALVNYINTCDQFPDVVPISSLPLSNIGFKQSCTLSSSGFHRVLKQIEKRTAENIFTYDEQLSLALFAITFCPKDYDVAPILENLQRVRKKHINADSTDNDYLYYLDSRLHNMLHQIFVCSEGDGIKTIAIQDYILRTDFEWASQMADEQKIILEYVDYSSCSTVAYELSAHLEKGYNLEDFIKSIIEHIELRMKELNSKHSNKRDLFVSLT